MPSVSYLDDIIAPAVLLVPGCVSVSASLVMAGAFSAWCLQKSSQGERAACGALTCPQVWYKLLFRKS